MTQRVDYYKLSSDLTKKYLDFSQTVGKNPLAKEFKQLVDIRASQINGCAFCLDMHVKEAKIGGERELRLHHIAIWHESPLFTPREKAALLWTEALTTLAPKGVSNEIYDQVRTHLSEQEISDLSFLIVAINGWNRISIAFRTEPGSADAAYGLDKAGLN
ncbi:carboxymuconolactone decarboxylase family protein [Serratia sp. M24T3]|uniref:carboxymuconolactone decarboxylase family protein n=1 Tax=Serratia sp. M24T3 TaxID=932213 RepID=UPI00025B9C11|nr:carboxymuconolactone decarboxylase family protein [Serratia sp. M24T3]EIC83844.1 alkylhydroperoxidase AhpD family core domain-containing protein 3 [Serratia sp. M24T3]